MSQSDKSPSKKVTTNPIDGMEVTDAKGRKLRLRKPDILDMYDLYSAIGEDTKNPACIMMATQVIYVATIDGQVVESPKSLAQFRATLKRVGEDGINAVSDAFASLDIVKSEKESIEAVKK